MVSEIPEEYLADITTFIVEKHPDKDSLAKYKLQLCKKYNYKEIPTDIQLLLRIKEDDLPKVKEWLKTKPVRTASGVVPIALMTRPEKCPHGVCTYCPGGPESYFGNVPQSYTGKEPSTMRSIRGGYDPYIIVFNRLEQFVILGHEFDKCDIIIQGGTFPSLPKEYQEEYVTYIFKAMNDFGELFFDNAKFDLDYFKEFFEVFGIVGEEARTKRIHDRLFRLKNIDFKFYDRSQLKKIVEGKEVENFYSASLDVEHIRNETSKIKCVGLTIETKPDWGLEKHGKEILKLGCTRVELGVQTVYDSVLQSTHRGHTIEDTKKSIRILKDLGFKLNFHMMLGLPGVNKEKDIASIKELFDNSSYHPDMLKIYPCMVMPGTALFNQYKMGKFNPIPTEVAADIIVECYKFIPEYCRIMRVQRDIPTFQTEAGVDRTNLRQFVDNIAKEKGVSSRDIRAREITNYKGEIGEPEVKIIELDSSDGKDFFISAEFDNYILGFVRMRFPSQYLVPEITKDSAMIRELHVYGQSIGVGKKNKEFKEEEKTEKVQHKGIGKSLMAKAEDIAKEAGKKKMLVISGVGVRTYYYKLGYVRDGHYVSKSL